MIRVHPPTSAGLHWAVCVRCQRTASAELAHLTRLEVWIRDHRCLPAELERHGRHSDAALAAIARRARLP